MAWILGRILIFILIFQSTDFRTFGNGTSHVSVSRWEVQNCDGNPFGLSSNTESANLVGLGPTGFDPGPGKPRRASELNVDAFVEETSFAGGSKSPKSFSADRLTENSQANESSWPGFANLTRLFHQTLERFSAYVRELVSQFVFGLGTWGQTRPAEIYFSQQEDLVEETSFAHESSSSKSVSTALMVIEKIPGNESSWPDFVTITRFFRFFLERFRTYVRELVSQLVFGLGTRGQTRPAEIHFSGEQEDLVEETSFAHESSSPKSVSTALMVIEKIPATDSSWPDFVIITRFFRRILERFRAYVRELVGILAEKWQLNTTLQEWNCRVLTIFSPVGAAVIIAAFFMARCFVNSALLRIEEELDQSYVKLHKALKHTRAGERKAKVLELELELYEREWTYQKIEFIIVKDLLDTINSKCLDRKYSLGRKQAERRQDKLMKGKNQTNLFSIEEELLSRDTEETENVCKLLYEVRKRLTELQRPIFDSSAGCSKSQFPAPRKEARGTQTA